MGESEVFSIPREENMRKALLAAVVAVLVMVSMLPGSSASAQTVAGDAPDYSRKSCWYQFLAFLTTI